MPSAIPAAPPLPTALPPSPLMKRSVNVVADPIDGGDVGREKRQRAAKAAAAAEGYGGVPSDDDEEEFTPEKRLRESEPTKSRYRGVKYAGGKYIATIQKGGAANREHIGCFDAEEDYTIPKSKRPAPKGAPHPAQLLIKLPAVAMAVGVAVLAYGADMSQLL